MNTPPPPPPSKWFRDAPVHTVDKERSKNGSTATIWGLELSLYMCQYLGGDRVNGGKRWADQITLHNIQNFNNYLKNKSKWSQ